MIGATSLDGRQFTFRLVAGSVIAPGDFVSVTEASGRTQLAQINAVARESDGDLSGWGRLVGVITTSDGDRLDPSAGHAFASAEMAPAASRHIELLYSGTGVTLPVGTVIGAGDISAGLLPGRFNRHTFWCGQSGSGKTYALGVVLEQLLIHSGLPMLVLDPNGDYVKMRELRDGATAEGDALAERHIRVLRSGPESPEALGVKFVTLPLRAKAAILGLEPLVDREEYNALLHLEDSLGSIPPQEIIQRLRHSQDPAEHALALRLENLRIVDWNVWAYENETVTDIVHERPDATIVDIGGFVYQDEALVVALALLDDLWRRREERRPLLIVIDEAHNLCDPAPTTPLRRAVLDRIIQIAAEGRKYGLWLLLSTQRPSKIHPNILSQCDNLALMKMSSPSDIEELIATFGFAPPAMLSRSPGFRQGEVLFAGGFVPAPTMIKVRDRLTHEGGVDVRVPLRGSTA